MGYRERFPSPWRSTLRISRTASRHLLIFPRTFHQEMKAGPWLDTLCKGCEALLVDLLQGLQLRSKVGIAREQIAARRPKLLPNQQNRSQSELRQVDER